MITKKLKPTGKLFTKDVSDRLMALAETPGPLNVVVFHETGIYPPFFEKLAETGRSYSLKTNPALESRMDEIRLPGASHVQLETDLSKRIQAIYMIGSQEYVLITGKSVIAADISEYAEGVALMGQIINYATELG